MWDEIVDVLDDFDSVMYYPILKRYSAVGKYINGGKENCGIIMWDEIWKGE